jgi:hypothetical protein
MSAASAIAAPASTALEAPALAASAPRVTTEAVVERSAFTPRMEMSRCVPS